MQSANTKDLSSILGRLRLTQAFQIGDKVLTEHDFDHLGTVVYPEVDWDNVSITNLLSGNAYIGYPSAQSGYLFAVNGASLLNGPVTVNTGDLRVADGTLYGQALDVGDGPITGGHLTVDTIRAETVGVDNTLTAREAHIENLTVTSSFNVPADIIKLQYDSPVFTGEMTAQSLHLSDELYATTVETDTLVAKNITCSDTLTAEKGVFGSITAETGANITFPDGFMLGTTKYDATGITAESPYVIRSPGQYGLQVLNTADLDVESQYPLAVRATGNGADTSEWALVSSDGEMGLFAYATGTDPSTGTDSSVQSIYFKMDPEDWPFPSLNIAESSSDTYFSLSPTRLTTTASKFTVAANTAFVNNVTMSGNVSVTGGLKVHGDFQAYSIGINMLTTYDGSIIATIDSSFITFPNKVLTRKGFYVQDDDRFRYYTTLGQTDYAVGQKTAAQVRDYYNNFMAFFKDDTFQGSIQTDWATTRHMQYMSTQDTQFYTSYTGWGATNQITSDNAQLALTLSGTTGTFGSKMTAPQVATDTITAINESSTITVSSATAFQATSGNYFGSGSNNWMTFPCSFVNGDALTSDSVGYAIGIFDGTQYSGSIRGNEKALEIGSRSSISFYAEDQSNSSSTGPGRGSLVATLNGSAATFTVAMATPLITAQTIVGGSLSASATALTSRLTLGDASGAHIAMYNSGDSTLQSVIKGDQWHSAGGLSFYTNFVRGTSDTTYTAASETLALQLTSGGGASVANGAFTVTPTAITASVPMTVSKSLVLGTSFPDATASAMLTNDYIGPPSLVVSNGMVIGQTAAQNFMAIYAQDSDNSLTFDGGLDVHFKAQVFVDNDFYVDGRISAQQIRYGDTAIIDFGSSGMVVHGNTQTSSLSLNNIQDSVVYLSATPNAVSITPDTSFRGSVSVTGTLVSGSLTATSSDVSVSGIVTATHFRSTGVTNTWYGFAVRTDMFRGVGIYDTDQYRGSIDSNQSGINVSSAGTFHLFTGATDGVMGSGTLLVDANATLVQINPALQVNGDVSVEDVLTAKTVRATNFISNGLDADIPYNVAFDYGESGLALYSSGAFTGYLKSNVDELSVSTITSSFTIMTSLQADGDDDPGYQAAVIGDGSTVFYIEGNETLVITSSSVTSEVPFVVTATGTRFGTNSSRWINSFRAVVTNTAAVSNGVPMALGIFSGNYTYSGNISGNGSDLNISAWSSVNIYAGQSNNSANTGPTQGTLVANFATSGISFGEQLSVSGTTFASRLVANPATSDPSSQTVSMGAIHAMSNDSFMITGYNGGQPNFTINAEDIGTSLYSTGGFSFSGGWTPTSQTDLIGASSGIFTATTSAFVVTPAATFKSTLTTTGNLAVGGSASVAGDLSASGTGTFSQRLTLGSLSGLPSSAYTLHDPDLAALLITPLASKTNSGIYFTNNGNGIVTMMTSSDSFGGSFEFGTDGSYISHFAFTRDLYANQNVTVGSTLTVSGKSTLNGGLSVTGNSTMTSLKVNGNLGVTNTISTYAMIAGNLDSSTNLACTFTLRDWGYAHLALYTDESNFQSVIKGREWHSGGNLAFYTNFVRDTSNNTYNAASETLALTLTGTAVVPGLPIQTSVGGHIFGRQSSTLWSPAFICSFVNASPFSSSVPGYAVGIFDGTAYSGSLRGNSTTSMDISSFGVLNVYAYQRTGVQGITQGTLVATFAKSGTTITTSLTAPFMYTDILGGKTTSTTTISLGNDLILGSVPWQSDRVYTSISLYVAVSNGTGPTQMASFYLNSGAGGTLQANMYGMTLKSLVTVDDNSTAYHTLDAFEFYTEYVQDTSNTSAYAATSETLTLRLANGGASIANGALIVSSTAITACVPMTTTGDLTAQGSLTGGNGTFTASSTAITASVPMTTTGDLTAQGSLTAGNGAFTASSTAITATVPITMAGGLTVEDTIQAQSIQLRGQKAETDYASDDDGDDDGDGDGDGIVTYFTATNTGVTSRGAINAVSFKSNGLDASPHTVAFDADYKGIGIYDVGSFGGTLGWNRDGVFCIGSSSSSMILYTSMSEGDVEPAAATSAKMAAMFDAAMSTFYAGGQDILSFNSSAATLTVPLSGRSITMSASGSYFGSASSSWMTSFPCSFVNGAAPAADSVGHAIGIFDGTDYSGAIRGNSQALEIASRNGISLYAQGTNSANTGPSRGNLVATFSNNNIQLYGAVTVTSNAVTASVPVTTTGDLTVGGSLTGGNGALTASSTAITASVPVTSTADITISGIMTATKFRGAGVANTWYGISTRTGAWRGVGLYDVSTYRGSIDSNQSGINVSSAGTFRIYSGATDGNVGSGTKIVEATTAGFSIPVPLSVLSNALSVSSTAITASVPVSSTSDITAQGSLTGGNGALAVSTTAITASVPMKTSLTGSIFGTAGQTTASVWDLSGITLSLVNASATAVDTVGMALGIFDGSEYSGGIRGNSSTSLDISAAGSLNIYGVQTANSANTGPTQGTLLATFASTGINVQTPINVVTTGSLFGTTTTTWNLAGYNAVFTNATALTANSVSMAIGIFDGGSYSGNIRGNGTTSLDISSIGGINIYGGQVANTASNGPTQGTLIAAFKTSSTDFSSRITAKGVTSPGASYYPISINISSPWGGYGIFNGSSYCGSIDYYQSALSLQSAGDTVLRNGASVGNVNSGYERIRTQAGGHIFLNSVTSNWRVSSSQQQTHLHINTAGSYKWSWYTAGSVNGTVLASSNGTSLYTQGTFTILTEWSPNSDTISGSSTNSAVFDSGQITFNVGLSLTSSTIAYTPSNATYQYLNGGTNTSVSIVTNNSMTQNLALRCNGRAFFHYEVDFASDRRLKENVEEVEQTQAVDIIRKLKTVSYNWKGKEDRGKKEIGFIAQDVVEQVGQIYDFISVCPANDENKEYLEEADGFAAGESGSINYKNIHNLIIPVLQNILNRLDIIEDRLAQM